MKLQDKVAVITGGNSGIGLALAHEFVAHGAKLALFGRDQHTLNHAAASLGNQTLVVQGDVRRIGDLQRLFEQVSARFGKIDVLVANAGIAKFAPVESMPEELFDELCDILFKGVFFTVQKAMPSMRDGASVILRGIGGCRQAGPGGNIRVHRSKGRSTRTRTLHVGGAARTAHPCECPESRHDRHSHY